MSPAHRSTRRARSDWGEVALPTRPGAIVAVLALVTVAPLALGDGPAEWTLSLRAGGSGASDGMSLGARADATAAFDIGIDTPEPPAPPGDRWVQIYATTTEGRAEYRKLDRSYVQPGDNQAWNISVWTGRAVPDIVLTWTPPMDGSRVYEISRGDDLVDLHTSASLALQCSTSVCQLTLRSYARVGTVPDPPREVTAIPGLADGSIKLTWERPATDGGIPIRSYSIWRSLIAGTPEKIGLTGLLTFTDMHREIGEPHIYTVRAENANGASNASNPAISMGTGRERTLTPRTDQTTWAALAGANFSDHDAPSLIPAGTWVEIGPSPEDPRSTEVSIASEDSPRRVGVFTAGAPVPPGRIDDGTIARTLPAAGVDLRVWSSPAGEVILGISFHGDTLAREEYFALTP